MTKPIPKGKTEPLIAAMLDRLPRPGTTWPAGERTAWLRMLANSFDVVYGPAGPVSIASGAPLTVETEASPPAAAPANQNGAAGAKKPDKRKPHAAAGCDFYVDAEGYARCDYTFMEGDEPVPVPSPERRILPSEVTSPIYDYRGARRDRDTVIWADDVAGCNGLSLEFCGPGGPPADD